MDFAIEVAAPRSGLGARAMDSGVKTTSGVVTFHVLMDVVDPAWPMQNAKGSIFKIRNALWIHGSQVSTNVVVSLDPVGLP